MNKKTTGVIICVFVGLASCLCSAVANAVVVDLDTSAVPELDGWGQTAKDLVVEWYPRISNLLGYKY